MSEISSVSLTSRGLGFRDYKPPVTDSPNLKTVFGSDGGDLIFGNNRYYYFAADPAILEWEGETLLDWWGKDLSLYLKTVSISIQAANVANMCVNYWEGFVLDIYSNDWDAEDWQQILQLTVNQNQFPAVGFIEASTIKNMYITLPLGNFKLRSDQVLEFWIQNMSGVNVREPDVSFRGAIVQD